MLRKIISKIHNIWALSSSERMGQYLRSKGVKVGDRVTFFQRKDIFIDLTRPSLIEIGSDVALTKGLTILTHGYDWMVLRNLFGELIPSSGKVKIGDNVFIGFNVTILKGVDIGSNSIIGAGSTVNKSIPSGVVAAGVPAKVICSIEEYRNKRKDACIEEALEYGKSIFESNHKPLELADFWEEFPLFLKGDDLVEDIPIKKQLGHKYEDYKSNNVPKFDGFESFCEAVYKRTNK